MPYFQANKVYGKNKLSLKRKSSGQHKTLVPDLPSCNGNEPTKMQPKGTYLGL